MPLSASWSTAYTWCIYMPSKTHINFSLKTKWTVKAILQLFCLYFTKVLHVEDGYTLVEEQLTITYKALGSFPSTTTKCYNLQVKKTFYLGLG